MNRKMAMIPMVLLSAVLLLAGCGQNSPSVRVVQVKAAGVMAQPGQEKSTTVTVNADASNAKSADGHVSPVDISDCITFSDVVDRLDTGMGFTKVAIDGVEVLIIADELYDYGAPGGKLTSYEGDFYRRNGKAIEYLGHISTTGTAYPLMIYDDDLYTTGNHYVCKYQMTLNGIRLKEEVFVDRDADGNATYYKSEGDDFVTLDPNDDKANGMYIHIEKGRIINFETVH